MSTDRRNFVVVGNSEYRIGDEEAALVNASREMGRVVVPDKLIKGTKSVKVTTILASQRFLGNLQVTDERKKNFGEFVDYYTDEKISPFAPELKTERIGKSKIAYSIDESKSEITSIILGKNIKDVCRYAFKDLDIRELVLSPQMDYIPDGMCYGCKCLSSIEIPSSVKSIGPNAFAGCNKLSQVYIFATKSSISIDPTAFGGNSKIYWIGDLYQKFENELHWWKLYKLSENQRKEIFQEGELLNFPPFLVRDILNTHYKGFLEEKKETWIHILIAACIWLGLVAVVILGKLAGAISESLQGNGRGGVIGFVGALVIFIPIFILLFKKIKRYNPPLPMGTDEDIKIANSDLKKSSSNNEKSTQNTKQGESKAKEFSLNYTRNLTRDILNNLVNKDKNTGSTQK
jgi:hypothetical protein